MYAHSQFNMFHPVPGGLNETIKEPVPRFLDETFKAGVFLLIDHLHKKTSLAAPEKRLDYYTKSKRVHIPTIT
jgi:hypothetical protein